jgi:hypothetical protein
MEGRKTREENGGDADAKLVGRSAKGNGTEIRKSGFKNHEKEKGQGRKTKEEKDWKEGLRTKEGSEGRMTFVKKETKGKIQRRKE